MPEYIEREALLKEIDEECMPTNWTNSEAEIQADNDYALYRNVIEAQPAADVAEVRHGEWKYYFKENTLMCSECLYEHYVGTYHQYATNYCPYCGVKMDKRKDIE